MHFALPPRKTSKPPPYATSRAQKTSLTRHIQSRPWTLLLLLIVLLVIIVSRGWKDRQHQEVTPLGTPHSVVVTSFDPSKNGEYQRTIIENRLLYAEKHGYGAFLVNKTDYDLSDMGSPLSWAKVPTVRHAMSAYPHSTYFFYLDENALIMRPELSIEEHIMNAGRLDSLMIRDHPVVPPDSVIHTLASLKPEDVDAVFTQDSEGIGQNSFIVRRGDWAKFFLDSWFDPLYRSYNFQRAERHALEHLVQWHGTVLVKFALVPQKTLNSYTFGEGTEVYSDGDFVANLQGCDEQDSGRDCDKEALPLLEYLTSQGHRKSS